MPRVFWIMLIAVIGTGIGSAAVSQELNSPGSVVASPITDHFAIIGGYEWGSVSTTGRFDTKAGVMGTAFNAESDLGLTGQARQPRVELLFRMNERHRFRFDFLDLSRTASTTLSRTIDFGGPVFQPGDAVQSEVDWRQMSFSYAYSFLRADRYELGLGLGLHLLQAEAQGNVPARQGVHQDFTGAGPFVTPGLDGTWLFLPRFALNARAQYLKATINGVGGSMGLYHSDVQYRWRPNLAIGAGYSYEQVYLHVSNRDPSGIMRLTMRGPELFVRVSF